MMPARCRIGGLQQAVRSFLGCYRRFGAGFSGLRKRTSPGEYGGHAHDRFGGRAMSGVGVRRDKAALSSGCESYPAARERPHWSWGANEGSWPIV